MKLKKFEQKDRYGNMFSIEFDTSVPEMSMIPEHPGSPKGTDTVPAWLTPGEFVMNAEAVRMFEPQIEAMNDKGRAMQAAQGGTIPEYSADGGPVSLPKPRPKMPDIPALEADQLYKMLKDRGFTDTAARGIMGNFYAESKLDPDAKQKLDSGKTGKGRGLAQWEKGGRFDTDPLNLVDFAAKQEKSWRDPEVQLDFMLAEMNNSEAFGDVRTAINAAKSPADAAKIFLEGYEKANPDKAHLDRRVDYAMSYKADEEPTMLASILGMFGTSEAQAATADDMLAPQSMPIPKPAVPETSRTPVMTAMTGQEMPVTSTIADMLAAAQAQYKDVGGVVEDDNYAAQFDALKKLAQQATANTGMYVGDEVLEEGGTNYDAARHAEEIQMMQKMRRDSAIAEDAAANEAAMLKAATPPPIKTLPSGDGDDLGTAPTKPKVIGKLFDNEVFTGIDGEYIIGPNGEPVFLSDDQSRAVQGRAEIPKITAPPQVDSAQRMSEQPGERAAYQADLKTEQSQDYQDMVKRARSAGKTPMSPSEWRAFTTPTVTPDGETVEAPIERAAILSDAPTAKNQKKNIDSSVASTEAINEGGTVAEADAAAGKSAASDRMAEQPGERKAYEDSLKAESQSEVLTAITKDIESINDGSADGTTTADASKAVVKAGAEGQEKTEQAESFLQGIFGDLFDKGELKRMAILYAGSRLMGGSHGGSLNWAAKQYLTRVDAKAAEHSAQVKKLINDGKYTPKSIQEYKKTKDASVLMKLGPTINPTGTKEMWYSPSGKRIQAEKFKVGDGHIWSADGGKTAIPASWTQEASRHKGTDEYNDRIRAEVPLLKDSIKELSTSIGDVVPGDSKAGRARTQKTNITPTNAAMEAAEWAAKNGLDVASMNTYVEQAYRMAVQQAGGENEVKPESLLPYLNQLKLRQDTGVGNLFTTTTKDGAEVPMDAVKVEELSLQFLKRAGGTGKISDGANRDAVNMFWTKAAEIWNKKVSETPDIVQQYQKRALPGETAFYAYAKEQLNLPTEQEIAMGDFDALFQVSTDLAGSGGHTFADADTLRNDEGNLLRIQGLEAAELAHVTATGLDPGTAGGMAATEEIMALANKFGFNNVQYLTNPDGTPMMDATGTRQMVRIKDKVGRDFTEQLTKHGINEVGAYSTNNEVITAKLGMAERASKLDQPLNDWEKAGQAIEQATTDEMRYEQEFKQTALNERALARLNAPQQPGETAAMYARRMAEANKFIDAGVQVRSLDRTLENKAVNPLSESFDVGLTGVIESMYGVAEMVGETTGWNWAEELGEAGVARQRAFLASKPELKLSALKPIVDKDGNVTGNEWDIDSVGEFFQYLGNNAAVSLPYMANTIAGTVLAPVTGGVSMLSPAAMYTGQTWNEMEGEDRNAGLAIAAGVTQAALDRLGLFGIMKGASILKKETRDDAVAAIVARDGVTDTVAKNMLANATRLEVASLAGAASEIAKSQLKSRNVLRSFLASSSKGMAGEAVTEAGQELTGYMAATLGSDKEFDAVELESRLLNATIAGGTLGAGFSIPGIAYDAGAWADVAVRQAPAEAKRLSRRGQRAEEEVRQFGRVKSIQELNDDAGTAVTARGNQGASFQEKVDAANRRDLERSVFDRVKDTWQAVPSLWRGATRFIFNESLQDRSRAMRILADTFGGNLQRTFSGSNFENRKKHLLTEYRNMVSSPAEFAQAAGFKTISQPELSSIINKFGSWLGNQSSAGIDWDNLPEDIRQHRNWLAQYYQQTMKLSDKLYNDQVAAAQKNGKPAPLGYIKNYLFKYKSFNKVAIEKDRNGFIQKLIDNYNYSRTDAETLTDNILNQETLVGEQDTFNVGQGKFIPAAHRSRTLNLSENPEFKQFMESDAFTNISNAAKSASRYITYQEFLGDNNAKVNELLNQALEEGVPAAEVNKVAAQMQDYLDAESGNYKRMQNRTLANIQKNLGIWTTIAGLPLATISSFVELAITTVGLPKDMVFKTIGNASKEMAQALWGTITDPRYNSTNRQVGKESRQENIKRLGFFDWDVGAAQTTGATENTHASRHLLDKYFKIIGLQQWTDYTRSIRASIANDFIMNHLSTIQDQRVSGEPKTNAVQESEEHLRNLGINVDDMLAMVYQPGPWSPEQTAAFDAMMLEAEFNFVNMAIALPGVANRPLFYQNQHLALFTQFQGFISTFTANQIPKMWGEYVARGTPAMKYNVFAVMATMLLLGFVSQYLKDLLKYGEPSPYLDDMEKLQRAVGSSGLLGTGERVLNFIYPIYESSSDNAAEWFFNTVSGEAAALSNVARVYGGAGKIIEGRPEKGVYDILKTAPFVGPFNQLNRTIASAFEQEDSTWLNFQDLV